MRDAEEYTISVRRENIEGDTLYVARVEELPDVEEYADDYEFAKQLAIDTIKTAQKMFLAKGMAFPEPKIFTEQPIVSGRVTLRLPKSLHAQCVKSAEEEDVSLNAYLITCIASYQQVSFNQKLLSQLENAAREISNFRTPNLHRSGVVRFTHKGAYPSVSSRINLSEGDDDLYESVAVAKVSDFLAAHLQG